MDKSRVKGQAECGVAPCLSVAPILGHQAIKLWSPTQELNWTGRVLYQPTRLLFPGPDCHLDGYPSTYHELDQRSHGTRHDPTQHHTARHDKTSRLPASLPPTFSPSRSWIGHSWECLNDQKYGGI